MQSSYGKRELSSQLLSFNKVNFLLRLKFIYLFNLKLKSRRIAPGEYYYLFSVRVASNIKHLLRFMLAPSLRKSKMGLYNILKNLVDI